MGFKADTSFLRFLSIGAVGARQVMKVMKEAGFAPIELDRGSTFNKIWATKIKRLRLPDILCVKTGLRIEVRGKTDLQIRMSDAPGNPERHWDAGMRDEDLAAFIACKDDDGVPVAATEPVFFTYRDLRESIDRSSLSDAKAASEGAETARTWPSTVPKRNGVVREITNSTIRVTMDGDRERSERAQVYQLRDKVAYVVAGDRFTADASIIAGVPGKRASLSSYLKNKYDPLRDINAETAVDRYAAVKALPFLPEKRQLALAAIEQRLGTETEERVLLEVEGARVRAWIEQGMEATGRLRLDSGPS